MTFHHPEIPTHRFAQLVTERTVERFLLRLFLRESRLATFASLRPISAF